MKLFRLMAILLVVTMILAACDGTTSNPPPPPEPTPTYSGPVLTEPEVIITIGLYDIGGEWNPFSEQNIERFNAELLQSGYNFNIRFAFITSENYAAQLQSGAVDVVYTGVGMDLLNPETLSSFETLEITDDIAPLFTDWQWETVKMDGEIKLIPIWGYYSPIKIWTQDSAKDFESVLDSLDGDKKLVFEGGFFNIYPMLGDCLIHDALVYDIEDATIRSVLDDKYLPVLQKMYALYQSGNLLFSVDPSKPFPEGEYAYITNRLSRKKPEGYSETVIKPYADSGAGTGVGIGSKHKPEAEQFLKILLTDKHLTRTLFYGTAEEPANEDAMQQLAVSAIQSQIFFGYTRFAGLYPDKDFTLVRPQDFDDPIQWVSDNTRKSHNIKLFTLNYDWKLYSNMIIGSEIEQMHEWPDSQQKFDDAVQSLQGELESAGLNDWIAHLQKQIDGVSE